MRHIFLRKLRSVRTLAKTVMPQSVRTYGGAVLLVTLVLAGVIVGIDPAHAFVKELLNGIVRIIVTVMLSLAGLAIQMTIFFLRFFINLASYNGYIDAPVVVVGWSMVRDISNMFFVIAMLVIAFATILGIEQYEWRKSLVKILLMAVFINFSNMIAQLIIDIAHIFTTTFLNAISAAAGGNLINLFKLDKILSIVGDSENFIDAQDFGQRVFAGAAAATVFAFLAMVTMGAYVFIMAIRVVVLWVAIIMAPLAFALSVIPATQSKAQEWWKEFTHHVLAAPIMVFFLWLAFATMGNGDVIDRINENASQQLIEENVDVFGGTTKPSTPKLSLSEVTTWDNMASFFVAMAFLWIGIQKVQELGVTGGSLLSSATNFAKNVATIATGYAAGRWLYEGGKKTAKGAAGGVLKHAPVIGTEKWKQRAKNEWESIKGWYYGKGIGKDAMEKAAKSGELGRQIENLKAQAPSTDAGERQKQADLLADLEKQKATLDRSIDQSRGRGPIGWLAAQSIKTEKRLAKTEKQAKIRREILWKRTGSEAGGIVFSKFGLGMDRGSSREAQDRIERGWLEAEKMRSAAKDHEYEKLGLNEVLSKARFKNGTWEKTKGSMMERIQEHEQYATYFENAKNRMEHEGKLRLMVANEKGEYLGAERNWGAPRGMTGEYSYADVLRNQSMTELRGKELQSEESRAKEQADQEAYRLAERLDQAAIEINRGDHDSVMKEIDSRIKRTQTAIDKRLGVGGLRAELEIEKVKFKDIDKLKRDMETAQRAVKKNQEERGVLEKKSTNPDLSDEERAKADEDLNKLDDKREELVNAHEAARAAYEAEKPKEDEIKGNIARIEDQIDTHAKNMESDWQYTRMQRQLKQAKQEKKDREDALKDRAQLLRNGGAGAMQVAEEILEDRRNDVRKAEKELGEARASGDGTKINNAEKYLAAERGRLANWESIFKNMERGQVAWKYAAASGRAADTSKGHRYAHNLLLSEAEQREVHDNRALDTPKDTLTELIEEYGKSFSEMSVDSFVANVGPMLNKLLEKRAKPGEEITENDKASIMGLFKRGFDRAWIDDAIYAIQDNPEANAAIAQILGWKDRDCDDAKVRDIQMLFASGADIDFVRDNQIMSNVVDAAQSMGMSYAQALEGLRNGTFEHEGENVTQALRKKVRELMEQTRQAHLVDEEGDQKKLFEAIFDGADEGLRNASMKSWMQVQKDNQSQLQFLGNLRPEALKNGHTENAGWALTADVGGGQTMYMAQGIRRARNHVLGDAQKMTLRDRMGMQSHSYADLDEDNGQVLTRVREDEFASLMSGADARTMNAMNTRLQKHLLGLSGTDQKTDFIDAEDGLFRAAVMTKSDGTRTRAGKTWSNRLRNNPSAMGDLGYEGKKWEDLQAEEQEGAMAAAQMQEVFAPAMRGSMNVFLGNLAMNTGISPENALATGAIRFKIYNPKKKAVKPYSTVQELISDYNNGDFGKVTKQIPKFVPQQDTQKKAAA